MKNRISPPDLADLEMYVSYPFVDIQGERGVWREHRDFKIGTSQTKSNKGDGSQATHLRKRTVCEDMRYGRVITVIFVENNLGE